MPLSKFAGLVASKHKINIFIDKSIDKENEMFYLESTDQNLYLINPFKLMLKIRGFDLIYNKKANFFYIQPIKDEKLQAHFFKLDAPVFEDLKSTLKLLDLKFAYIENTHTLTYVSTLETHLDVKKLIHSNDDKPEQFSIKISILETNLNEVKDRGTNLQAYTQSLQGSTQYFMQLLSMPFSSTINTFETADLGITGVLRYLDQNGITNIRSSPYFTVQSNKEIYFSAVNNIPYKVSSSDVNGATQTTTETIAYKDVGLIVKLLPRVVNELIYIDLDLTVENLLDKGSLTPSTSKKNLRNSFQLERGKILVLSGINQDEDQNQHYGIPLLQDIPLIGGLFSFDTTELIKRNLTITIEVI